MLNFKLQRHDFHYSTYELLYDNPTRTTEAPFTLLRFCTKTERKLSVFVKVFRLIRTKTPQKRRFSKTLSKVDIHKNGGFENAPDQLNAEERRFLKTLQYSIMVFTKTEQCERTKTDVFPAFLLSGTDQCERTKTEVFLLHFCTETEQCERVASMQQKRTLTKTEQC